MTNDKAREILKKHAAAWGDSQYEPSMFVIDAMKEAAETCAVVAWTAGMDYHTKALGMPCDAREVGSAAAHAIRAL